MKPEAKKSSPYASPDLSSERVARMWSVIERAQSEQKPRRARGFALALAACAALAFVAHLAWRTDRSELASAGDVIVTEQKASELTLPDGSRLSVGAATELSVTSAAASEVRLRLHRGSAHCDVVHKPERRFIVETDDLYVQVKGTRFRVDVAPDDPARVAVQVERGRVEVRHRDGTLIATLGAGQTWTQQRELAEEPVAEPADEEAAADAPVVSEPAPKRVAHADVGALFERANAARMAGDAREAAQAYDKLRARFPRDPRAGLAAFELARIRLHSLHDARGALSALRFALAHQGPGFLSEDAQALQVDALDRLGDHAACVREQSAFLQRYPKSAHGARVAHACRD